MAGFTIPQSQAMLDAAVNTVGFPTSGASDFIAYSTNGTSETANLTRTAVGATGWAAATNADPSVKANNAVLTSAAVITGAITVTHFAIYTLVTAGVQRIDWTALAASRALSIGDSVQWAIGACQVTLT